MKKTNPEELLAAGLHFGHKSQRVHPKSYKYIYKMENGISIIDLFKTAVELDRAKEYIFGLGKEGKTLLVVATKKQARPIVTELCKEIGLPYLTNKWIGGFLTNFDEMKKNISKMTIMKKDQEEGEWKKFPKHEQFKLEKQLTRISKIYEGVTTLTKLPDALFVVDIKNEANSVNEATDKNIPVVAIADTNSNPFLVQYPIPANDDAATSIEYVVKAIFEAYTDGRKKFEDKK